MISEIKDAVCMELARYASSIDNQKETIDDLQSVTRTFVQTIVPLIFPQHSVNIDPVGCMPQEESNEMQSNSDSDQTITTLLD